MASPGQCRHGRRLLLCVLAYALFGPGFLVGFGGASAALTAGMIYAGLGLAVLGGFSAILSSILCLFGLIRTGKALPWAGLLAWNLGFVAVVLTLCALDAPRGAPGEIENEPADVKPAGQK